MGTYQNMRIQFALALLAATDCSPISALVDVDARGKWKHKGGWSGKGKDWYNMWMAKKGLSHLGSPKSPASPVSPSSSAAKSPSDAQVDIQSPVQSVAQTPAQSPDAQVDQPVDNGIDNLMEKLKDQGLEEKLEDFKTEMLPKLWEKLKIMSQMKRDSYRRRGDYGYKDEKPKADFPPEYEVMAAAE